MSENAKKAILIVVAVVAIVLAGFGAKSFIMGDQRQDLKPIILPPGTKPMKQQEMEAQKRGQAIDSAAQLAGPSSATPTGASGGK